MALDVVMTCCRDEEDIIATFVRYYLDVGFGSVHVIDNGSIDATAEIVSELIAEGLPVTLERDGRLGYERYLTKWFLDAGLRFKPRWLFFLDCDEFILLPRPAFAYLDALPPEINRLRLRQREMFPMPQVGTPPHFLLSRRTEPHFNDTTKDVVCFHPDARVYGGKHRIDLPEPRTRCPMDIFIRHYKYRSPEQARRKEGNRCQSKRIYSDGDLSEISANGIAAAREWHAECERAAIEERWRENFEPRAYVEDEEMADWARGFLRRIGECV